MYETYYGLQEKPFGITPDPRYLYLSRTHQEAFAHLFYGLSHRVGFIAMIGEVGSGKTTILRSLAAQLDESSYRLAMIFNPRLTPLGLLQCINSEFGLAGRSRNSAQLVRELNEFLLAENRSGRTPVLIIDEAQNLATEVLEQIRLLSNLETARDKLIQIVLVGQPELGKLLMRTSLRQLNQRIVVRCRLEALDSTETSAYILHRLKVAGRADGLLFTAAALDEVHRCSLGFPRLINSLCDRALLVSFAEGRGQVNPGDVRLASREIAGSHLDAGWRFRYDWLTRLFPWSLRLLRDKTSRRAHRG
jgi:general secretion pathway protein A